MKAILIDARMEQCGVIDIDGSLSSIYAAMSVKIIQVGHSFPNGDTCYVDEEGLLNGYDYGFSFGQQPFVGNGLIVGSGPEGEGEDCKTTLMDLEGKLDFLGKPGRVKPQVPIERRQ